MSRNRPHSLTDPGPLIAVLASLLVLSLFTVVLLPYRDRLSVGTVALILLLPPLVATVGGLRASLLAALVCALTFNFFFTHPFGSPLIEAPESVAAFAVYIVITATLGIVVSALRSARLDADARRRRAELVQSLTVGMISNRELEPTLRSGLELLVDGLNLRGAALRLMPAGGDFELASGDAARAATLLHAFDSTVTHRPALMTLREDEGAVIVPVAGADGVRGLLVADRVEPLESGDRALLEAYAGIVALASTRDDLDREAARRKVLEETDRLRSTLLQSLSHDLRTPLTAIRATAAALRDVESPAQRLALLDDVEAESVRLERLVANMLDLSRIETGSLRPQRERVPLDDLVWDAVSVVRRRFPDAVIEVRVPDEPLVLEIDETMIGQVLVNLLENAVVHEPEGMAVAVRLDSGDGRVTVAVSDHGPGVPVEERERIFQPYHRLQSARRPHSGSGLGLAICRAYARAHGGDVSVEHATGGGARFSLVLPGP